jgi:hypothetical protein
MRCASVPSSSPLSRALPCPDTIFSISLHTAPRRPTCTRATTPHTHTAPIEPHTCHTLAHTVPHAHTSRASSKSSNQHPLATTILPPLYHLLHHIPPQNKRRAGMFGVRCQVYACNRLACIRVRDKGGRCIGVETSWASWWKEWSKKASSDTLFASGARSLLSDLTEALSAAKAMCAGCLTSATSVLHTSTHHMVPASPPASQGEQGGVMLESGDTEIEGGMA